MWLGEIGLYVADSDQVTMPRKITTQDKKQLPSPNKDLAFKNNSIKLS